MKSLLVVLCYIFLGYNVNAQDNSPVQWSTESKRLNDSTAMILIKAKIEEGWHLYSQELMPSGPQSTEFYFEKNPAYTLIGNVVEPKPISKFEQVFEMNVLYFEKSVLFTQKVNLKADSVLIKGEVLFMACNDETCMAPTTIPISVSIK
ncbi:MAG: protein-disulfide reductase DsbD domain-containing protein [Chitinophagaceae bacterium]